MLNELMTLRHYLHKHPEVSGNEIQTQRYLKKWITDKGLQMREIGRYGLLIEQKKKASRKFVVRVDCDALPIQEISTKPYTSEVDGVMHACGHDGHTTSGIGLALELEKNPIEGIQVDIMIQPAEENGEGARSILDDANFDIKQYESVLAYHNLPGYPLHEIVTKYEAFTPAVTTLIIKLKGKTSHAAEPEFGFNPALAMSEITIETQKRVKNDVHDLLLITPVYSVMGSKSYGVSAGYGELHFTVRCLTNSELDTACLSLEKLATEIAQTNQIETEFMFAETFRSIQNDEKVVRAMELSAQENGFSLTRRDAPFKWGEDFGLFTEQIPGAMFGIGSGEHHPALHNPDYDFPDEILDTAVKQLYSTLEILAEK
ncbi:amidohydrolase [bacterium]|nr:MAG: amidohydrolase [bacterium]